MTTSTSNLLNTARMNVKTPGIKVVNERLVENAIKCVRRWNEQECIYVWSAEWMKLHYSVSTVKRSNQWRYRHDCVLSFYVKKMYPLQFPFCSFLILVKLSSYMFKMFSFFLLHMSYVLYPCWALTVASSLEMNIPVIQFIVVDLLYFVS